MVNKYIVCVRLPLASLQRELLPTVRRLYCDEQEGVLPPHMTLCFFTTHDGLDVVAKKIDAMLTDQRKFLVPAMRSRRPTKEENGESVVLIQQVCSTLVLKRLRQRLIDALEVQELQSPLRISIRRRSTQWLLSEVVDGGENEILSLEKELRKLSVSLSFRADSISVYQQLPDGLYHLVKDVFLLA